jgi:hypothetical protein
MGAIFRRLERVGHRKVDVDGLDVGLYKGRGALRQSSACRIDREVEKLT